MRFVTAGMSCPIRQQMCPRNAHVSGLRRYGRRHALSRLKRFGHLNHGVIPSGRSLYPALETSSGDTRRRRHHSSSVMPLGVERSSQANAVTPGCGRGLSYCNADNSRSSMTHAAPAASVLFRLGTLVLMPVKIHPGWAPPDRFLLLRILSLRQLEHGHGWQNPISTQHHCFDGNNK